MGWTESTMALEERFLLSFMHLDQVSGGLLLRTVTFTLISEVIQSLWILLCSTTRKNGKEQLKKGQHLKVGAEHSCLTAGTDFFHMVSKAVNFLECSK